MPIRMTILLVILITAGACSTVKNLNAANEFSKSAETYNRLLRWHEMEMAGSTYAAEAMREEFAARAKTAKDVTITDYRIKSQVCTPETNEAKVVVDIDYFVPPSVTVKTVEDVQKWEYVEINEKKFWRLMTLPPDFK